MIYDERMKELRLFRMQKRRQGDLITIFKHLKHSYKENGHSLLSSAARNRTRGDDLKIQEEA